MIKNKKVSLSLLSLVPVMLPTLGLISCGDSSTKNDNIAYEQSRRAVLEKANYIAKTNATTFSFNNTVFESTTSTTLSSTDLSLIFANNNEYMPIAVFDDYFILETDASIPSVLVQANIYAGENASFFQTTTFFKITSFGAKFDLNNLTNITAWAKDENVMKNIPNPKNATAVNITKALIDLIQEYLQSINSNINYDNDYDVYNFTKADGTGISEENLQENSRAYHVTISAKTQSVFLTNKKVVTIILPQLKVFDVSVLNDNFNSLAKDWNVKDPTKVSAKEVTDNINKQIVNLINQTDTRITNDDLLTFYSLVGSQKMPQIFDLTKTGQQVQLTLAALPYSKITKNNKQITVTLPTLKSS